MKISKKEKVNKMERMKQKLRAKIDDQIPSWKTTSSIMVKKERSVLEEN